MRRSDPGFTLLEVLAAVALLGIVYTVLAGVTISGLRAEGLAQRKLEASLLADASLARIELELAQGTVATEGESEDEVDIFVVRTIVEPFEVPIDPPEDGEAPLGSLLEPNPLTGSSPMRRIELRVSWLEGDAEHSVVRITFGFDLLSLVDQLPTGASALGGGGGDGGGDSRGGGLGDSAGDSTGPVSPGGLGREGRRGRFGVDRDER